MTEINFKQIENKWQEKWEKERVFEVSENKKPKFYVLEMFPYPSGDGLHMGHALNYTIGDVLARFKRMKGFNVLYPMGYDALGLPAENAAIKAGIHPQDYTDKSINNYIRQQKELGLSYDWTRMVNTASPGYYKWDQWIFLKMFEKGLAYQKEAAVNWCPKCQSVLANEQVVNGKCWRHEDTDVEIKHLKQWFFKITDYADELYEDIDGLDWPERTKAMQKNWIGKSHGVEIDFEINNEKWKVFTTRPDTIFGVTFMVVSAQHPRLMELVTKEQKKKVEEFLKKIKTVSQKSMKDVDELNKEGVFTGSYAVNPATNEKVPVYAGNFVVADYGSGMVMAVPAHDQRDFEFAKKYGIGIKQVIEQTRNRIITLTSSLKNEFYEEAKKFGEVVHTNDGLTSIYTDKIDEVFEIAQKYFKNSPCYIHSEGKIKKILIYLRENSKVFLWSNEKQNIEAKKLALKFGIKEEQLDYDSFYRAYTDSGKLVNSSEFNGLDNETAKEQITNWLEKKKKARKVVNFRLRDWLISRQRYWGTPIPIIYCDKCGAVPVAEKDLPVKLPKDVKFGKGNPLLTNDKWINAKCPSCGGKGKRETDTMDTFVNSSWYYLRYADSKNNEKIFDSKKANYWCPIDQYIGGAEHATMHLIYVRFYTKFLADLGLINFREPAKKLFHQGMLAGEGGVKMSKSKGNVINPDAVSEKYGIDTARYFLLSLASPDKPRDWSEKGIQGSLRFIKRIFDVFENVKIGKDSEDIEILINKAVKDIEAMYGSFDYRTATIRLKELFENFAEQKEISKKTLEKALIILHPICPHITEELWEKIGNKGFVSLEKWPEYKEIREKKEKKDINQNIINYVSEVIKKVEGKQKIEKVFIYVMPFEIKDIDANKISKALGKETKIFAVNDPEKYDPENKAKKALPGKPGVYLE